MQNTLTPEEIEQLARKRAGAKMGWYIHALVFIAVNTGLALISGLQGKSWALYPALGWGIGLLAHGLAVFIALPGGGLHAHLLAQERDRLQSGR